MSIKNELVCAHIEALPIGAKLSVRGLAAELNVSEGTVYKAIKDAQARGLVVTRPKAGTFRVDGAAQAEVHVFTLAGAAKFLGLTVEAGEAASGREIRRVIVCDSDEEQLRRKLAGDVPPKNTLCLVGNRPELHKIALETGANLLLTDGCRASAALLSRAEQAGVCVMHAVQSTYTVLRLLSTKFTAEAQQPENDGAVYEWMQTPDYLYYNDIVADWHRFFQRNLSAQSQYPVVDDELRFFGALDIQRTFAAMPSQKLSGMLAEEDHILRADARDSMRDVAQRMVLSGANLAAVISGGRLEGVLSANDLLRYYLYAESNGAVFQAEPFLEEVAEGISREQMRYRLRIPESAARSLPNLEMNIMLAAAGRHVEAAGCTLYQIDSGTFYAPRRAPLEDDLLLTSTMVRSGGSSVVEVEIHDEAQSFARALLVYSPISATD